MKKYSLAQEVLGVSSLDQPDSLYESYKKLTDPELDLQQFEDECNRLDAYDRSRWHDISIEERERITTLSILRQIFVNGQIQYSNVLQHWPMYEEHFNRLQLIPPRNSDPRQALQVGCLTALSAAAFAALAKDIYDAEPLTIDLTTSTMRERHGEYRVADALNMDDAVENESIHLAQTNCLLHMLKSKDDGDPQSQTDQLFAEMHRVVQPGGGIILREIASGLDTSEHPHYNSKESKARFEQFKEQVYTGLARAGFLSITIEPATNIVGTEYLFDPERDFTRYPTSETPATIVITAVKAS